MRLIQLTQGYSTKVDDADYAWLMEHTWCVSVGPHGPSAMTWIKGKGYLMSRLIMGVADNVYVDHKNGDRLDNRRKNLRVCTSSQNSYNRRVRSDSRSGIKGVKFMEKTGKWWAQIKYQGKATSLGHYLTAEEASQAYINAAKEYAGEYSYYESRGRRG